MPEVNGRFTTYVKWDMNKSKTGMFVYTSESYT